MTSPHFVQIENHLINLGAVSFVRVEEDASVSVFFTQSGKADVYFEAEEGKKLTGAIKGLMMQARSL